MDKLKEECGVFGILNSNPKKLKTAEVMFFGLYALQHRGQESAGMAIYDEGKINNYKGMGLLQNVFGEDKIREMQGDIGIGHVRYSTAGGSCIENAQPIVGKNITDDIALAHNGNLINAEILKAELAEKGFVFQTTADSEVIMALFLQEIPRTETEEEALTNVMKKIKGAYAVVIIVEDKLIAARDPLGMRPLVIGKLKESYIVCSESCALDCVGATFIRDVEPGEIITIDKVGMKNIKAIDSGKSAVCIFEYVYFARPDSNVDGAGVYNSRLEAGRLLAKECKIDADIVIGVPDSGIQAALGYSRESGIPYSEGFIKNRYIGRTFIQPSQFMRERSVKLKLNPLKEVDGKRVIMIDDSIVRGTTSKQIVEILRKAGAKEVHFLVVSPPVKCSCYFGIDTPHIRNLIANTHTIEEIKEMLGVDSLYYLSLESLKKAPHRCKIKFLYSMF